MDCRAAFAVLVLSLTGCARQQSTEIDVNLAGEIATIRAIDNHAHPVRASAAGEPADREFDALPVDNMEPATDPLPLRADAPGLADAWQALFGSPQMQPKQH